MGILALDLDGTLLRDDGVLGEGSKAALHAAKQNGWVVCFVTGRREVDMRPLHGQLDVADYLLLNNGGKIIRCRDGAVLQNIMVNVASCERLVRQCFEENWQFYAVNGMRWWVNRETGSGREYARQLGIRPTVIQSAGQLPCDEVEGFMITRRAGEVAAWIAESRLELEVLFSEPGTIDVMEKGVGKLAGVNTLAGQLGHPVSRVIAMGNYDNDIDMIRGAGLGIAVNNATEAVKAQADYITARSNNQDAVVEVVERFILRSAI